MKNTATTPAAKTAFPTPALIAQWNNTTAVLPGWQIKEQRPPHVPVAVVMEPLSGQKSFEKRSLRQEAWKRLFVAAPKLLAQVKKAEKFMSGFEDDEEQVGLATDLATMRQLIDEVEGRA